ncbi:MAG: damage-control phosphatase ARMT1 family protein [Anaerolineae bacterium]|nr:damage-control phosphatase ARMT1 family protein [Anaerolineae bacterium]
MPLTPPNPLVPPIRTDGTNDFADRTVKIRIPDILDQTLAANPDLPAPYRANLRALREEVASGAVIAPVPPRQHPEYDGWHAAWLARQGKTWREVDWFFCETYVYRRIMAAVNYFETGLDPFLPIKQEEYAGAVHQTVLDNALQGALHGDPEARLRHALTQAVFGNRVDLSYAESRAQGLQTSDDDLAVDDRARVVARLVAHRGGVVRVVADNAGSELSADLCLIDLLLRDGWAGQVFLHVKLHPTFVSDVIADDVTRFLGDCAAGRYGADAAEMAVRLQMALADGRLVLRAEPFWNSPYFAWEMPDDLAADLQSAALVIVKGDANYRRFVGDAFWPHETPFGQVVGGLAMPLLMLRTLKSDPIVGLPAGLADRLDAVDARWRWNGKRAVIQLHEG